MAALACTVLVSAQYMHQKAVEKKSEEIKLSIAQGADFNLLFDKCGGNLKQVGFSDLNFVELSLPNLRSKSAIKILKCYAAEASVHSLFPKESKEFVSKLLAECRENRSNVVIFSPYDKALLWATCKSISRNKPNVLLTLPSVFYEEHKEYVATKLAEETLATE